jgi:hypothetical protein
MASYHLPVSNTVGGVGAIVDTGATQDQVDRQFQVDGVHGDVVAIFSSADNFVTDSQPVLSIGLAAAASAPSVLKSIARYYRTMRLEIGNPASPACNCWMTDAVTGAVGGTPSGGASNIVTYQEGGTPNPALGIYPTFATALAAARAIGVQSVPIIVIDPSFGQPVIPPGVYNLAGIAALTAPDGIPTKINIQEGAVLQIQGSELRIQNGLILNSQATATPPIALSGGLTTIRLEGLSVLSAISANGPGSQIVTDPAAGVPLINMTVTIGPTLLFLFAEQFGVIAPGGAVPVIAVAAGANLVLSLAELSLLKSGAFSGAGAFQVNALDTSVTMSQTQPAVTGAIQFVSRAAPIMLASADACTIGPPLFQRIPPGEAPTTDGAVATVAWGVVMPAAGIINSACLDYQGDAANVAGQLAHLRILKNGLTVFDSATPAPTTAGDHQVIDNNIGLSYLQGDRITLQLVLSAVLTNPLTQVSATIAAQ